MFEPRDSSARRNLVDGGFVVLLLSVAIASGYVILSPGSKSAPQAGIVGSVEARSPVPDGAGAPAPSESVVPVAPAVAIPDGPRPAEAPKVVESPAPAKAVVAPPIAHVRTVPDARPPIAPPKPWRSVEPTSDTPWPSPIVTGRVVDSEHKPLPGASIVVRGVEIRTDAEGAFKAERVPPDAALLVKLPGFEKTYVAPTRGPVEVVLKPQMIKAAYLTYYGVADKAIRERVLDLVARTELNAVVIDVKGDRGLDPLSDRGAAGARRRARRGRSPSRTSRASWRASRRRGIYTDRPDRHLQGQRPAPAPGPTWPSSTPAPASPGSTTRSSPGSTPSARRCWDYNIAIGQGGGRQGLRRGPVRLRPLPHRRQAVGREVLPAQQLADPAARHRRLPGQGPARARPHRAPS